VVDELPDIEGMNRGGLEQLKARDIAVHEQLIRRLEGADGRLTFVPFVDGGRIDRRTLFFNTGQHPRSALLKKLGCRYGEKGVDSDENGGTSIPGVYVAAAASASALLRPSGPARGLEQAQGSRVPLDEATKPAW
jgi:thioredoxin reductase